MEDILEKINKEVNRNIWPVLDIKKYSTTEYWADAELEGDNEGDCEDYCIVKRRKLVEAGVDRDKLNIAVVLDKNEQGHAVLIVDTERGQVILDNMTDRILPWDETGYKFLMIETSERDLRGNRVWRKVVTD